MTEPIKAVVAYYQVSDAKPGALGLGLEGQVAAVEQHARDRGAIIRAYQEVESGKKSDRPELANAVAHARRSGAILVIAKLDRLARDVHFLAGLMEAKVDFVACDNLHANHLTVRTLAAVAEAEARRISEPTVAAWRPTRAPAASSAPRGLVPPAHLRGPGPWGPG